MRVQDRLILGLLLVLLAVNGLPGMTQETAHVERDYWPTADWRTDSPEAHGLDPAILDAADVYASENLPSLHSLLIVRDGYLVWEKYYHRYTADSLNNCYSVTKSFTSALVGIALESGAVDSLDVTFASYFPEYFTAGDDSGNQDITLRDLLMMRSGLGWKYEFDTFRHLYGPAEDEIGYIIALPQDYAPGEHWAYSTGDSHLVSGMLTRAAGESLLDYAQEHLFQPLGIQKVEWSTDPAGYNYGGAELYLRARDMAKFGFLYLNDGSWDGQQIVPAAWVDFSTTAQPDTWTDGIAYSKHWWKVDLGDFQGDAAMGYAGQIIAIFPDQDMVIVATNMAVLPRYVEAQAEATRAYVADYILPAVEQP